MLEKRPIMLFETFTVLQYFISDLMHVKGFESYLA